ncbi:MAG TPA: J domain-containing protein [Candidatus Tectomicrobia bacterium]|nr:J domain-containing protein [Candidatus Tectomicrobia bacterium]
MDHRAGDHYEVLQVSRRADPLIITKAFRVLAAVYHPDNKDTGDAEMFQRIVEAHTVLSDPVSRAAYDRRLGGPWFPTPERIPPLEESRLGLPATERQLRQMILQALLHVRRSRPSNPGVSMAALVELCGCTVDQAQFSLWYLRGKRLIDLQGDGDIVITVAGVDLLEGEDALGVDDAAPTRFALPSPPGRTPV